MPAFARLTDFLRSSSPSLRRTLARRRTTQERVQEAPPVFPIWSDSGRSSALCAGPAENGALTLQDLPWLPPPQSLPAQTPFQPLLHPIAEEDESLCKSAARPDELAIPPLEHTPSTASANSSEQSPSALSSFSSGSSLGPSTTRFSTKSSVTSVASSSTGSSSVSSSSSGRSKLDLLGRKLAAGTTCLPRSKRQPAASPAPSAFLLDLAAYMSNQELAKPTSGTSSASGRSTPSRSSTASSFASTYSSASSSAWSASRKPVWSSPAPDFAALGGRDSAEGRRAEVQAWKEGWPAHEEWLW